MSQSLDTSLMSSMAIAASQKPSFANMKTPKVLESSSPATSLKVVIVGSEGVGKTSFVRRFVAEELGVPIDDVAPTASSSSVGSLSSLSHPQHHRRRLRERPPGTISTVVQQSSEVELDIYELEFPTTDEEISTSDDASEESNTGNLQTLSIWDFSGRAESLQAVQKVFFTPQTIYVVLWDMAVKDVTPLEYECVTSITTNASSSHLSSSINNQSQHSIRYNTYTNGSRSQSHRSASSSFNLNYDSDSDSSGYDYDCDVDLYNQEELREIKRKLEKDIDKKVQSWIDRIQEIAPGATILPMVTHTDRLRPKNPTDLTDSSTCSSTADNLQQKEVKKRCWLLKERLTLNESRKVEGLEKTCFNGIISSPEYLSRPNILFGSIQKDGQLIPHALATNCMTGNDNEMDDHCMDDVLLKLETNPGNEYEQKDFLSARNFIFDSALSIASGENWEENQEPVVSTVDGTFPEEGEDGQALHASLATAMLRDVRHKLWHRSKIVQTNYFIEKFETRNLQTGGGHVSKYVNKSAVLAALNSLHLSGELCYFGGMVPSSGLQDEEQFPGIQPLSGFVVLDPTWLVDSIDFIFQYGRKFVHNIRNSRSAAIETSGRHRATNCPTIEKEEVRRLWKKRFRTTQGLGLAEHYHQFRQSSEDIKRKNSVADQVFEFIQNLLILHDVFVPLSYQKSGSTHFFLPCLLHRKKAYRDTIIQDSSESKLSVPVSSILQGLTHSTKFIPENEKYTDPQLDIDSANLKSACHGFVIVDTAPEALMERTIIHTIKALRGFLNTNEQPKIEVEEFYFWKDSFRLKLRSDSGDNSGKKILEINSILLEAPGSGTNSRIRTCESMLVTYVQGYDDPQSKELWRQICSKLRGTIQNALDQLPGIEYREEGICPHCLRKKHISDTGTWTLSKLKAACSNKESFVRCRHGHRTETKLNGLLHCQLTDPPCGASSPASKGHDTSISVNGENLDHMGTGSEPCLIVGTVGRKDSLLDLIVDHGDVVFPSSTDFVAGAEFTTRVPKMMVPRQSNGAKKKITENDAVFNSKVTLLLDRCRSKMGQVFNKKNHLSLDNRNLTDSQIPMEKLNGTEFGHRLQSISLTHNKLEMLPHCLVCCLPNLRSLNLSHCLIYELPKRWNLPLLRKLDISENLLIEFPKESALLGLLQLEDLNLSGNKLTKVKVSKNPNILKKLKRLDLSSNELTSFPTSLKRFKALRSLDLRYNNIKRREKS